MIIVEDSKPSLVAHEDRHVQSPAAVGQLSGHFGPVHPRSKSTTTPGAASSSQSYSTDSQTPPLLVPPPPSFPKSHHPFTSPTPAQPAVQYRQSPARRFWKAFGLALLIYFVLLGLARTTIVLMAHGGPPRGGNRWEYVPVGHPLDEDGRILESIGQLNWTSHQPHPSWAPPSFSGSAETSFILPISSEELYLISRGSYQGGKVQVKQATKRDKLGKPDGNEDVRVDVRVAYRDERALAHATVCRLRRGGNRHGVGIYTSAGTLEFPTQSDQRLQLYFEVVFTFPPAKSENTPLRVRGLTTNTYNYAYEIGDLWQSILFDKIELRTTNSPVHANSITLTRGSLTSSNGKIVGHFNASDALILHTSNAPIQATLSLLSAGVNATKLDMYTSNGPITSSVSLIAESDSGGKFAVKAHSSNGAIRLEYDDMPLRARLASEVRTSNGPATVIMHPAYEGSFDVRTSNSRPVVQDTHPADPLGAGRLRIVNQAPSRGMVLGKVYWAGNEGERRSTGNTCTVHTSNARASLSL